MSGQRQKQAQKLELHLTTISGASAHEIFNSNQPVKAVIARARQLLNLPPNPPREYVAYLEIEEGKQRELRPDLTLDDERVPNGATVIIVSPQNKDG